MIGYFMTKPTQGAAFKRFQDQFIVVIEDQYPGSGNIQKYHEYKVIKHGQKLSRNEVPVHK